MHDKQFSNTQQFHFRKNVPFCSKHAKTGEIVQFAWKKINSFAKNIILKKTLFVAVCDCCGAKYVAGCLSKLSVVFRLKKTSVVIRIFVTRRSVCYIVR